ncbi:Pba1p KNAG_0B02600 [Huiozyma naganishii CBS 8797]|uniref:Proteasome assembly chaperone 1 n=1 Tax=Huiozyma naganishii (strain ATCC MYA-139 / BCRC 22969 / CBS 8797 / KCTC 17520 / NBRC 10181 / NCYC 3082 / Yp74L-3) TaxID=1071383 RepID=J7RUZ5_HUIN7|nr:hypothetical protein KNAG_0B02600 [Kazachstania naganishii CBS 8797]CCK68702.1 hypothetical protein KNAG_0B02600 [Kazachstania naganishii CBS 8797]
MLFKHWNEFVEPRHHLDAPVMVPNQESLQALPLPTVTVPAGFDWGKVRDCDPDHKIMNPLFNTSHTHAMTRGELVTSLQLNESVVSQAATELSQHWDYRENFPNEFDPASDTREDTKSIVLRLPIVELNGMNTLLISVDENFLKVSPIFTNVVARKLRTLLNTQTKILLVGSSDKIYSTKMVSLNECTLQPPEFITGFLGGMIDELVKNRFSNFKGFIVQSEGPTGFEKLSLESMDELIDFIIDEWSSYNINADAFRENCHKLWKLDGAAMSAQSGLYI